ncbi:MAG TPA: sulfite exporter TauE/SafE family protein [Natronosporangium sp.]
MLLLYAFVIVLAAAAVQAVTGFGFALIAVPLLTLATEPRTAVVASGIAGLSMTVMAAIRERDHARWRVAGALLAAAALGMPVGLLVLRAAPERTLTALIGVAVVGCALPIWRGLRLPSNRPAVFGVGLVAGVLSTSTGTNGPPLVAAFQAMGFDPRTFRATLAAVFSGSGTLSLAGFFLAGQVTADAARVGLIGVPAVLLGWWAGNLVFHRIDPGRFRRVVLAALVAGGAILTVRALSGG